MRPVGASCARSSPRWASCSRDPGSTGPTAAAAPARRRRPRLPPPPRPLSPAHPARRRPSRPRRLPPRHPVATREGTRLPPLPGPRARRASRARRSPNAMAAVADFGVIGGSGFYEVLTDAREARVDTPFGAPSETPLVGEAGGKKVAFIPRHGRDHRYPPHKIPYRANLWALRALGVRQILAPSAVGSLTASYGPGA